MSNLNELLLRYVSASDIFGYGNVPASLAAFAIICAKYLIILVMLYLILVNFCPRLKNVKCFRFLYIRLHPLLINCVIASIFAAIISYFIGLIYPTPRPFVVHYGINLMYHKASPSFPSDHAIFFAIVIYFIVKYKDILNYYSWVFSFVIISAVLCLWARVFCAVHYPLDIVGGLALGLLCAYMVDKITTKYLIDSDR